MEQCQYLKDSNKIYSDTLYYNLVLILLQFIYILKRDDKLAIKWQLLIHHIVKALFKQLQNYELYIYNMLAIV